MNTIRSFMKTSTTIFVFNIIGKSITFFTNLIILKNLGNDVYGNNTLIYSFVVILSIIPIFGMDSTALFFSPRYEKESREKIISFSTYLLFFVVISSTIVAILMLIFHKVIAQYYMKDINLLKYVIFYSPLIIFYSLNRILSGILLSKKEFKINAFIENIIIPIMFIVGLLVSKKIGINRHYYMIMGWYFSYFAILLYVSLKKIIKFEINIPIKSYDLKEILTYSGYSMFASSIDIVRARINIILVGMFLNSFYVSLFSIASQLVMVISFILKSITQVFNPIVSKLYDDRSFDEIQDLYGFITLLLGIISVIIYLALLFFKDIIFVIIGKEYVEYSNVILILGIGQLISAMSGPSGGLISMFGKSNVNMIISLISLIINIVLAIFFIPKFGVVAAAIISSINIALANILRVIIIALDFKIYPFIFNFRKIITIVKK